MSHIVTIQTKILDAVALAAACRRLGLATPTVGTARLFSSQATGQIVLLPGWTYPIVIDTNTGDIKYDNFAGHWGEESQLHKLLQRYAAEKATLEARRKGHSVTETPLPDGSIKLTVQVGGAAS
jgi:hypothetical protein